MVKTFFTNKETIKKILVALIIVITCNFILPYYSNVVFADINDPQDDDYEPGGSILKPIRTFLLFLGDSVINILQHSFVTQQDAFIHAKSSDIRRS